MKTFFWPFFSTLLMVLFIILGIHLSVLYINNLPLLQHKIILSYTVNIFLVIVIFLFLYFYRIKYKEQLGFLYLIGSFLKFFVFFILFYPSYHKDGHISRIEFLTFFIPYASCLIIETFYLIKLLNSRELNQ